MQRGGRSRARARLRRRATVPSSLIARVRPATTSSLPAGARRSSVGSARSSAFAPIVGRRVRQRATWQHVFDRGEIRARSRTPRRRDRTSRRSPNSAATSRTASGSLTRPIALAAAGESDSMTCRRISFARQYSSRSTRPSAAMSAFNASTKTSSCGRGRRRSAGNASEASGRRNIGCRSAAVGAERIDERNDARVVARARARPSVVRRTSARASSSSAKISGAACSCRYAASRSASGIVVRIVRAERRSSGIGIADLRRRRRPASTQRRASGIRQRETVIARARAAMRVAGAKPAIETSAPASPSATSTGWLHAAAIASSSALLNDGSSRTMRSLERRMRREQRRIADAVAEQHVRDFLGVAARELRAFGKRRRSSSARRRCRSVCRVNCTADASARNSRWREIDALISRASTTPR